MLAFLLLITFARFALSFGDVGKSERLFYYYAYLLDANLHPGAGTTKIATDCGNATGIGKKGICSFDQFNKYIAGKNPPTPEDGWEITNEKYPRLTDISTGKHGMTGVYSAERLFGSKQDPDVAKMIRGVVDYVDNNINKLPDGEVKTRLKDGAWTSIQGILGERLENKSNSAKEAFAAGHKWKPNGVKEEIVVLDIRSTPTRIDPSSTVTAQIFDIPETLRHNPEMDRTSLQLVINDWEQTDGDGHRNMITESREGTVRLGESCR